MMEKQEEDDFQTVADSSGRGEEKPNFKKSSYPQQNQGTVAWNQKVKQQQQIGS